MIGNKHNKRKGQVLLIAIMLVATILTVVMTVAFNSTRESQNTKLEEDSQQALAAAQAGIEAALKQGSGAVGISSLGEFSSQGITGNAQVTAVTNKYFVTPLIQKDEQFTFYLTSYPLPSPLTGWTGSINMSFVSESGCPVVELTVIKADYSLQRVMYGSCNAPNFKNIPSNSLANTTTFEDTKFQYKSSGSLVITDGIFIVARVLNSQTKIAFEDVGGNALPLQGKTVTSEAKTQTGVTKKIQMFQSYPQIPANFLTSSF